VPAEIFVGRSREMTAIESMLIDARAGEGRLVLLTGEPGIGKSRLAEEVARRAEASGWIAAWGRSWEGPGTPAYWPWTQIMRRLGSVAELRTIVADADLRALLDPGASLATTSDAEHARFLLFDRVARTIHGAAARRPLLLVLDDLHAADSATLMLLQFVARGLHGNPVLLLATARDTSFAASPQTTALLAQASREARHVPLERLDKGDLSDWIARARIELEADRVWDVTEGNPLFVEELLAAAKKRPDAAWTASQMPLGIREAMRVHLSLVSDRAEQLLETASVLGRELSLAMLKLLARVEDMGALDEALASGIFRDAGEGRLRFSHILLRDELYARLPEEQRCALHRQAAFASQSRAAAAHHILLGAVPEDARATLDVIHAAMREASGKAAHEDAARLGRRALEAWEAHLTKEDVCTLLVSIGEALVLAGDLPGGQAVGERAALLASELALPELLARAVLVRAVEISFVGDPSVVGWLRKALAALPEGDSSWRAQVSARLALALNNTPTAMQEQRQLVTTAVAMARRLGDEKILFTALHNAAGTFPDELTPRDRFALYAETVDLAEKTGTIGKISAILVWHVVSWLELGEPERAQAATDRVERLLEPYTQPHFRWRLPLVRAMLASLAGRFSEAERLSGESLAISQQNGIFEGQMMHAIHLTGIPYLRGDDGGLAKLYPSIEQLLPPLPLSKVFAALWEAPLGRVERVRESIELLKTLPVDDVVGAAQLGWACVRVGLGEYGEFFHELVSKLPIHNALAFGPGGFACMGPTSLLRGQLAAMTGRREAAAHWFVRAAEVSREIKSPPLIAQAEISWAEILAAENRDAASEHAQIAFEHARSMEMDVVVARAEKLMKGRLPARAPATVPALSMTLRRSGEVWSIEAGRTQLTLIDSKGMKYLEALVLAPHRQLHVLELAGIEVEGDAGPQLDEKAKQAYRVRAEDLRAQLEEANAFHDEGRIERVHQELDLLGTELARAFGLGGRERRAGSPAERARINVQRRLRDVIRRIGEQDSALGRHLDLSVKTGLFCMYAPTWPER
jgi:hypothetical protein